MRPYQTVVLSCCLTLKVLLNNLSTDAFEYSPTHAVGGRCGKWTVVGDMLDQNDKSITSYYDVSWVRRTKEIKGNMFICRFKH